MNLNDNGLVYIIDKILSTVFEPVFGSSSATNVNRFLKHIHTQNTHSRSRIAVFHYCTMRIKHCLRTLSLRKVNSKLEIFVHLEFYAV